MIDKKADAAFIKEKALVNEVGDIVARLQAGEDVFQEFYEKTKRYVYYIAISNGVTQNDAEDVVQDTFVHFFKKYKEIENPSSAMSWLKRSAFGHSIDCLKKKKDVCLAKDEDTEFDAFDTDALIQPLAIPETALEEKERARIISEIVDSLPEDQKKCVLAYYYSECKIKDIAAKYGVPENTVKTNLSRGRKNIEKQLELFAKKHGVKLTSVAIIPFFALAYSEKAEACSVALAFSAVAEVAGISAGTISATGTTAAVVGTKVGIGGIVKIGGAFAAKSLATKVAIAVLTLGVIGGGTVIAANINVNREERIEQQDEDRTESAITDSISSQVQSQAVSEDQLRSAETPSTAVTQRSVETKTPQSSEAIVLSQEQKRGENLAEENDDDESELNDSGGNGTKNDDERESNNSGNVVNGNRSRKNIVYSEQEAFTGRQINIPGINSLLHGQNP